jgi:hypothetical protein
VKRENSTVVEAARTMICAKNLDVSLWAEGVNTAVYILNITGTRSEKVKASYDCTIVYTHIPKQKRRKWDPKSEKGIFVGYSNDTKGYRVWYSKSNKILCRDIIFEKECTKFENIITNKLEFTETSTQIDENENQVKDKVVVDDNRMVLRDRNTLRPPDTYNV